MDETASDRPSSPSRREQPQHPVQVTAGGRSTSPFQAASSAGRGQKGGSQKGPAKNQKGQKGGRGGGSQKGPGKGQKGPKGGCGSKDGKHRQG